MNFAIKLILKQIFVGITYIKASGHQKNEILKVKHDEREEALEIDKQALEVYNSEEVLVDHVPIELSSLLHFFYKLMKRIV